MCTVVNGHKSNVSHRHVVLMLTLERNSSELDGEGRYGDFHALCHYVFVQAIRLFLHFCLCVYSELPVLKQLL